MDGKLMLIHLNLEIQSKVLLQSNFETQRQFAVFVALQIQLPSLQSLCSISRKLSDNVKKV